MFVKTEPFVQETGGGKKAPVIPKSQEVKYKKEPLYSTILQFPGPDSNPKVIFFNNSEIQTIRYRECLKRCDKCGHFEKIFMKFSCMVF